MAEEKWEEEPGITRRRWLQVGISAGAMAAGAAATGGSAFVLNRFLPPLPLSPPITFTGEIQPALVYTAFITDQWWNGKAGTPVKATDFQLWWGATAIWRGLFQDNEWVPGTGYPALVIRVPRDDTYYNLPASPPWTLPDGFALFYDDPVRDIRIVAGLDRCTHLCCYPGWHVVQDPPPPRNYTIDPPTYSVYGQDPIYCVCHDAQYDPLVLVQDVNPRNNTPFPGMQVVHGPAVFSMPLIPLRAADNVLVGGMADPRWYAYC